MAWCFMGNHFHLLLEVPDKDAALKSWTEEDFLERLEILADDAYIRKAPTMGAEKARASAGKTLKEVRDIIGFKPF